MNGGIQPLDIGVAMLSSVSIRTEQVKDAAETARVSLK